MAKPIKVSRKEFEEFNGIRWNAMNDICSLSDIKDLTPVQRVAYLAYWYMSEVENGGHFQYFANEGHFDHDEVARALTTIGATEEATILNDALKKVRLSPIEQPQTAEQYLADEEVANLSHYDVAFAECKRSVFQCLEDYLNKHETEFIEWIP